MLKSCAKATACFTTMNEIEKLCEIWYHFCNLKKCEKQPWGSARLRPLILLKETILHDCFSCFKNCISSNKSRKASYISTVPRPVRHGSSTINQVDFPSSGRCSVNLPYFLTLLLYLIRIGDIWRLINLRWLQVD